MLHCNNHKLHKHSINRVEECPSMNACKHNYVTCPLSRNIQAPTCRSTIIWVPGKKTRGICVAKRHYWDKKAQHMHSPSAKAAPAPTFRRMGLQKSQFSFFFSESLSFSFICCTFCAVLAILSSRFLLRRLDSIKTTQVMSFVS